MKSNRELDELIYKLLHNVDEIPPPQEYVDFSSRSVEYVDQVPNYTESVDNALSLLGSRRIYIESIPPNEEHSVVRMEWFIALYDDEDINSANSVAMDQSLSMAICLAWLSYKGYSNARED